jgi:hypothetical protein
LIGAGWRSTRTTSSETSRDRPSAVLKPITRTGALDIGLAPGAAYPAEVVQHEKDVLVIARHDRGDVVIYENSTAHGTTSKAPPRGFVPVDQVEPLNVACSCFTTGEWDGEEGEKA